jgi:hypothetical protein
MNTSSLKLFLMTPPILIILVVMGVVLTGCGSFVIHEQIDPPVHKIALLSISHAGDYFVEQINPYPKFKVSNQPFESEGFDLSAYLQETIISQLAKRGIEVVVIPIRRDDPHKLLDRYDSIEAQLNDVDALLEVLPTSPGYNFGSFGEHSLARLRPMVGISAQVVSARTHKIVYRDRFGYGYQVPKTVDDDKYVFEDLKTLESNPKLAVAGLKHAIRSVVAYLVSEISP